MIGKPGFGEIEEKDKECIKILSGEDVLSENAEEDNQIGDKEEKGPVTLEMDKEPGARMMLFKSQNVAGGTMKKRMVQGLVSPRKRPSAKAGIRQDTERADVQRLLPLVSIGLFGHQKIHGKAEILVFSEGKYFALGLIKPQVKSNLVPILE
ncbi:unnamed protein product [Brassica oleracea]|uniref:(rape) hypothetical protein n=1 Tax=Brassica napus TaxID=3708 RepID=A0A816LTX4_BRANA|nr:unnamed protein product [Brassica napus]